MKVGRMVGDREPEAEPNAPPEGGKGDVDEGREGAESDESSGSGQWRAARLLFSLSFLSFPFFRIVTRYILG
jgi:hypothetical protein